MHACRREILQNQLSDLRVVPNVGLWTQQNERSFFTRSLCNVLSRRPTTDEREEYRCRNLPQGKCAMNRAALLSVVLLWMTSASCFDLNRDGIPRRPPISPIACNQQTAAVCQQQAHGCMDNICPRSQDPEACRQGCIDRYKECKVAAGCGDY